MNISKLWAVLGPKAPGLVELECILQIFYCIIDTMGINSCCFFIHLQCADADGEKEVRIVTPLRHQNIIRFLEAVYHTEVCSTIKFRRVYIFMEWMAGKD